LPQNLRFSHIFITLNRRLLYQNGFILEKTGRADRRLWELALVMAMRDALRSGELCLPESRHHVSFSNLIYNQQRWTQDRTAVYAQLNLFEEQDAVIAGLTRQFEEVTSVAARSMNKNPFASIVAQQERNDSRRISIPSKCWSHAHAGTRNSHPQCCEVFGQTRGRRYDPARESRGPYAVECEST
jgi:hypothetical protein